MPRESFHIWQYFRTFAQASLFAEVMERMTGDMCTVIRVQINTFKVLRYTSDGKTVTA